jgi:hypothetical protein
MMVVTNDDDRHACYAKVMMHTFDEVDVVDVDMHPPSKPKHPPSLPSLFTTLPSFLVYHLPFLPSHIYACTNHQVNPNSNHNIT